MARVFAQRPLRSSPNVVDDVVSLARRHDVAAEGRVVEGDAAGALIAAAKEQEADLIVMGSHGRPDLRRVFLDSVVRTAPTRCSSSAARFREGCVHGRFMAPSPRLPKIRAMRYRSGFLRVVARCLGLLKALGRRQPQFVAMPVRLRNPRCSR